MERTLYLERSRKDSKGFEYRANVNTKIGFKEYVNISLSKDKREKLSEDKDFVFSSPLLNLSHAH
jgi:hypothetical protein